jgi:hypothetical protein
VTTGFLKRQVSFNRICWLGFTILFLIDFRKLAGRLKGKKFSYPFCTRLINNAHKTMYNLYGQRYLQNVIENNEGIHFDSENSLFFYFGESSEAPRWAWQ